MNRRFQFLRTCGLAAGMLSVGAMAASAAPSFQGLGFLPGGVQSSSFGVSADGSAVVGSHYNGADFEAFRWDATGGMVGLGHLPSSDPGNSSEARAVSADGSVVVGFSAKQFEASKAFRWDETGGMVALGGDASDAFDVSADGSVIVGIRFGSFQEAFRWDATSGVVGLGLLPGSNASDARAVSADGSVVVGASGGFAQGGVSIDQAFRWNATDGMVGLGFLPGYNVSFAGDVSADGSIVVGTGRNETGSDVSDQAFRWDATGGMVGLGFLPGHNTSSALAVSADGSVVVGHSGGSMEHRPFIWDATNGMRDLQKVLVDDCGLDLTGWMLFDAAGISANGRTIVGGGVHDGRSEAWSATIPEPSSLALLAFALPLVARRLRSTRTTHSAP